VTGTRGLDRRALTWKALLFAVFCCVSGGPYGLESVVGASGPGLGLVLICLMPLLWAVPDALTTCELAPAIPQEGGYVVWVRRALGPFAGFVNAWWTWLYSAVDAAIYPVLFAEYLGALLDLYFGTTFIEAYPALRWGISVGVIVVFVGLNIRGTRLVGTATTAFALIILAPFLALMGLAVARMFSRPELPALPFLAADTTLTGGLAAGLGIVMWNYLGWDQLSTVAEEVEDPARSYPRALIGALLLVTFVYVGSVVAGLVFVPEPAAWTEESWPALAQAAGGPGLALLVGIGALVSPIALFVASVLGSSRVPLVLAQDGFLPRQIADIHPLFGTPWRSLLLCGVIYAGLTSFSFLQLVELNVLLYSAALMLEQAALVVLRYREPDLPRPFRIGGGNIGLAYVVLAPALTAILLVVLSIQEEGWAAQIPTAVLLASGPLAHFLLRPKRAPTLP
jgi:amino acid transporter